MFEGLDWKSAFKRAAIFVVIWLGLVYVSSVAFPGSLGVQDGAQLAFILLFAVVFLFGYTVVFAFSERRKKRRLAELKAQRKDKPGAKIKASSGAAEDGEAEPAGLKGRHNPNTSRKKASRRRRR